MKIQKNFFYTTSVNVCEEQLAIPMYGFDLVSFNDIQSRAFGDMFLIGKFLMLFVVKWIVKNLAFDFTLLVY